MKGIADVVHDNPESTILIHFPSRVVRVDVGKHREFDVEQGDTLSDVGISEREKERRKRRKDLKLKLQNSGMERVRNVYAISRINEDQ